jgi:hypothetical protein
MMVRRNQKLFHGVGICEEIDFEFFVNLDQINRNTCNIHSATGLVFPGTSKAPPIQTIRPMRSVTSWLSLRIINARFVRGPRAMYVTLLDGRALRISNATSTPER